MVRGLATSSSASRSATDVISNLANFLPTGTFLAFQTVAPLFTNNGLCGNAEKVVTSLLISIIGVINIFLAFTDSIAVSSGKQYYGIVTSKGLYNPQFSRSSITGVEGSVYTADPKYTINIFDFLHAIVTAAVFCTLAILTPPVQSCFFPDIPDTIVKSVPILVAILAGAYFAVAPPPRKGVGYSAQPGRNETVPDEDDHLEIPTTAGGTAREATSANNNTDTAAAPAQSSSKLAAGGRESSKRLLSAERIFPSSSPIHASSESHV